MAKRPLVRQLKRLRLESFNNLTKSLAFNLYDICYAKTPGERRAYLKYIDEVYNADSLTRILTQVSDIIGANILNIARQDYEPQGASVTMLISEGPLNSPCHDNDGPMVGDHTNECLVGHLDKSHLTVHTYPEMHPHNGICTFRADIEVSTCGKITPLNALNFLLKTFDSDVLSIDYYVRGFTRDVMGRKHFIDHRITSIQDFIEHRTLDVYNAVDVNMYQRCFFHTDLMRKDVDLDRYLFGGTETRKKLKMREGAKVRRQLSQEISEIFQGRNL
jgi:S-adenosylmethionine decarboxylase